MLIGIRVDVAVHIGTGHLQRCLTLATRLSEMSCECIFFLRDYHAFTIKVIEQTKFQYVYIGQSRTIERNLHHTQWLGVDQEQDADEFLKASVGMNLDAIIVDHYALDHRWHSMVRTKPQLAIMVIDDLANRLHDCDLLLDQNLWPDMKQRYQQLVPTHCIQLVGPKYALLRHEFARLRTKTTAIKAHTSPSVLVNFGGVGNFQLWNTVLPALVLCSKFRYQVITGRLPKAEFSQLLKITSNSQHIHIQETSDKMSEMMLHSDYCLGACGSTVWERFCLGLNAALIDVAENQKDLVKFLFKNELIDYLGSAESVSVQGLNEFLQQLDLCDERLKIRQCKIMSTVDGLGATYVSDQLIHIIQTGLHKS